MKDNLREAGFDEGWLYKQIKQKGLLSLKTYYMRNGKQMMASFVRKCSGRVQAMYVMFVSKLSFTYQKRNHCIQ